MDKQEARKQKIEAALSDIRRKGAELEEALQIQRGERIFATPKNSDEAEGSLPTLEALAQEYSRTPQTDWETLSKEQILVSGTLIQKLRLFLADQDLNGYFGSSESLSDDERIEIIKAINTSEDHKIAHLCFKEYETLQNFGRLLSYFFKRFQASYAILAILLNKWDSYQYTAKQLSLFYELTKTAYVAKWAEEGEISQNDNFVEFYPEEVRDNLIFHISCSNLLEGVKIRFRDGKFVFDESGSDGIFSQIQKEAASVTQDMANFKAYALVAENFVEKSISHYLPVPIRLSIENAKEEKYTRFLVQNLKYFRSELTQKRLKGENITPEEDKLAVIPDFYEVRPTPEVLRDCKAAIRKM